MIPLLLDLTHSTIFQKGSIAHLLKAALGWSLGKRREAVGNFLSQYTANEYHLVGRKAKSCWLDQVCFVPASSCVLKRDIHKPWAGNLWKEPSKTEKSEDFKNTEKTKMNLLMASLIRLISPSLHYICHMQGNYYQYHYSLKCTDESTLTAHNISSHALLLKQGHSLALSSGCISFE